MRTWIVPLSAALLVPVTALAVSGGFDDVSERNPHAEAIVYLLGKGVVTGYKDQTFRPERTVNRAEFMKVLTTLLVSPEDIRDCQKENGTNFSDVPSRSWFAPFVCAAASKKFAGGYEDQTFRPADTINFAEAAKILVQAFDLTPDADTSEWFTPYIRSLGSVNAIPPDVGATGEALTRGVMAEMLWRLKENVTTRSAVNADELLSAKCRWFDGDLIPHVDMQEVSRTWLSWINAARHAERLPPYEQNKQLNRTASLWSMHAKNQGSISHKRTQNAAYYDYQMIRKWFQSHDLDFVNDHSATFTENIGWGVYSCKKSDCTAELISAIRPTFDFYMNEKEKTSRPHYNSIMNDNFTILGTGIAVDKDAGKVYVTTHYGTSITSHPAPVCP